MIIGWLAPDAEGWVNPVWLAYVVIGDEWDMEESIERAWLERTFAPARRRQKFRPDILEHYPLTQPPDICTRCMATTFGFFNWDLDHIVELQYGGLDHPANLIRLCKPCHAAKPHPPEALWDDHEAIRRFILGWVRRGPADGKRVLWPDHLSDHLRSDPTESDAVRQVQQ